MCVFSHVVLHIFLMYFSFFLYIYLFPINTMYFLIVYKLIVFIIWDKELSIGILGIGKNNRYRYFSPIMMSFVFKAGSYIYIYIFSYLWNLLTEFYISYSSSFPIYIFFFHVFLRGLFLRRHWQSNLFKFARIAMTSQRVREWVYVLDKILSVFSSTQYSEFKFHRI